MRNCFFIFTLFFVANTSAQVNYAPLRISEASIQATLTEKEKNSRVNYKTDLYKTAFYAALDYYPELKNVKIKVKAKKLNMLMKARPTFLSSWRRPAHRKYKILVNTSRALGAPLPGDFTFNAQVGVFGHEMAHLADYLHMRCGKLAQCGRNYHKPDFKKRMEQKTDKMTLEHGLGWQLYDYSVQWNNLPLTNAAYVETKKKFYIDPKAMLGIMLDMGYQ